jgi:hypothetical protein
LEMINRILTTPRSNTMQAPGAPGLQIGGGIAGFASMLEAPSIKIYNERQKYNEWEFIYDMKKDKRLLGAAAGGMNPNQPQNPLGANPMNPNAPNPMMQNPAASTRAAASIRGAALIRVAASISPAGKLQPHGNKEGPALPVNQQHSLTAFFQRFLQIR